MQSAFHSGPEIHLRTVFGLVTSLLSFPARFVPSRCAKGDARTCAQVAVTIFLFFFFFANDGDLGPPADVDLGRWKRKRKSKSASEKKDGKFQKQTVGLRSLTAGGGGVGRLEPCPRSPPHRSSRCRKPHEQGRRASSRRHIGWLAKRCNRFDVARGQVDRPQPCAWLSHVGLVRLPDEKNVSGRGSKVAARCRGDIEVRRTCRAAPQPQSSRT